MSFPRYPKYKDSGVEWLGEVPQEWVVSRLKFVVAQIATGGTPDTARGEFWAEESENGIPWVSIGDMTRDPELRVTEKRVTSAGLDSKRMEVLPAGTILYSMFASLGKVAKLSVPAAINQAILGITPNEEIVTGAFLKQWLGFLQSHIERFSSSNTQDNLNAGKVRSFPAVIPSLPEQHAIASFLDRETAKIDALIAEQQRLIELLQEKRQAVISHAVTKGLNPDAPMKDSGIEWLGEVPAHWELMRVSRLFRASKGKYGQMLTKEYLAENAGQFPVYSGQTENEGIMGYWSEFEFDCGNQGVLFSTTVGAKAMSVSHLFGKFSLSQNCMIIEPISREFCTRFFYFQFQPLFANHRAKIPEHMQASFRMGDLYAFRVVLPPVDEQVSIAQQLDAEMSKFDSLSNEAEKAIFLLRERRSALISAAVTGQIDLRGLGPKEAA